MRRIAVVCCNRLSYAVIGRSMLRYGRICGVPLIYAAFGGSMLSLLSHPKTRGCCLCDE